MGLIEWTGALKVGIPVIDEQHQVLVGLINQLDDAARSGKTNAELGGILKELDRYTRYHFGLEEKAFEDFGYPDARKHIAEHAAFIGKIDEFELAFAVDKTKVGDEILDYLKGWLTHHISFTDKKYKPFLHGKL
jgi:hemerythrin-like metal-binding protein